MEEDENSDEINSTAEFLNQYVDEEGEFKMPSKEEIERMEKESEQRRKEKNEALFKRAKTIEQILIPIDCEIVDVNGDCHKTYATESYTDIIVGPGSESHSYHSGDIQTLELAVKGETPLKKVIFEGGLPPLYIGDSIKAYVLAGEKEEYDGSEDIDSENELVHIRREWDSMSQMDEFMSYYSIVSRETEEEEKVCRIEKLDSEGKVIGRYNSSIPANIDSIKSKDQDFAW